MSGEARAPGQADAAAHGLERLAHLVEAVSGIVFPHGQLGFLRDLMAKRAAQAGFPDLGSYLAQLERGLLEDEWRHLLPAITVKESFLFRVPEQFRALRERILPQLVAARRGAPLRLWSAGCAHGEEPATLAVVLAEAGLPPSAWSIVATDVDERALQVAQAGAFSQRAVGQVPPELLARHFLHRGDRWILDPELMARVELRRVNLVREPFPDLGGPFDVILLRNVLIYFRPESQRRVVAAVADNLAADGCLFLGHSESLWQLTDRLGAVDLGGCFAYRHQEPAPAQGVPARAAEGPERRSSAAAPRHARPPVRRDGEAPAGAAAPTAALSRVGRGAPPPRTGRRDEPRTAEGGSLGPPRVADAVPTVADVAAALGENHPRLAAERVAARLAAVPDDPAAHALAGLLHDLGERREAALAAYRAALFLAPGLYQVRLLLADALRRGGWAERARAEYRRVLGELEAGGGAELPSLAAFLEADRAAAAARCRSALARL